MCISGILSCEYCTLKIISSYKVLFEIPLGFGKVASETTATHVYTSACKLEVIPRALVCFSNLVCSARRTLGCWPYSKDVDLHSARRENTEL